MHAAPAKYALLNSLDNDLRFVLITSQAKAVEVEDTAHEKIEVTPSPHPKCERCWHYREEVGSHAEHPALCGRCVSNLFGEGEPRTHA